MACFAHDYFRLRAHDPDDIPYVLNDLGCLLFPPKMSWAFPANCLSQVCMRVLGISSPSSLTGFPGTST